MCDLLLSFTLFVSHNDKTKTDFRRKHDTIFQIIILSLSSVPVTFFKFSKPYFPKEIIMIDNNFPEIDFVKQWFFYVYLFSWSNANSTILFPPMWCGDEIPHNKVSRRKKIPWEKNVSSYDLLQNKPNDTNNISIFFFSFFEHLFVYWGSFLVKNNSDSRADFSSRTGKIRINVKAGKPIKINFT